MKTEHLAGSVILLILVGAGLFVESSSSDLAVPVSNGRTVRNLEEAGSRRPAEPHQSRPAADEMKTSEAGDMLLSEEQIMLIWDDIQQFDRSLVCRVASPARITIPITDALRQKMRVPDGVTEMVVHEASVVLRQPTSDDMNSLAVRCRSRLPEVDPMKLRAALSRYCAFSKQYRIVSRSSRESWSGAAPGVTWTVYDCDEVTADLTADGTETRFYSPEDPSPVESVPAPEGMARYEALLTAADQ